MSRLMTVHDGCRVGTMTLILASAVFIVSLGDAQSGELSNLPFKQASKNGWTVGCNIRSTHPGSPHSPNPVGTSCAMAHAAKAPPGSDDHIVVSSATPVGKRWYVRFKQGADLSVEAETPLAAKMSQSGALPLSKMGNRIDRDGRDDTGYDFPNVTASKQWKQVPAVVHGNDEYITAKFHDAELTKAKQDLHIEAPTVSGLIAVASPGTAGDLVTNVEWPGANDLTIDANALTIHANADQVPEPDASGDITWAMAPETLARLTSAVSVAGCGAVTYTHTFENFFEADCTFAFEGITTPAYPAGWSGTVAAGSSTCISFTDTGAESTWVQSTQVSYTTSDLTHDRMTGANVYVPESRRQCRGIPILISASRRAGDNAAVVKFQTVGDIAETAVLCRRLPDGTLVSHVVLDGPLAQGVTYEIVHPDPAPTGAACCLEVGSGANGVFLDDPIGLDP